MNERLVGSRVVLQLLKLLYFTDYLAMYSPMVSAALRVSSKDSEAHYLNECLSKLEKKETLFYCIFDKPSELLIGGIEIRNPQVSRGQLYSWLHESFWGNGRYQEALSLITQEYFSITKALFFTAHVDITNHRSYHALKKFGCAHGGFCEGPYGKQYTLIIRKRGS